MAKIKKQLIKYGADSSYTSFRKFKRQNVDITIFTDSKYVVDGITKWIFGWLKNNWNTASKKPVANRSLWEELFNLTKNKM